MSSSRGQVFKRNNKWGYRFSYRDTTRERHFISAQGFESRSLADTSLTAALAQFDAGRLVTAKKISLNDYLDKWYKQYERSGRIKESTAQHLRQHINGYIVPMLGGSADRPLLLGKLSRDLIKDFYATLLTSGCRGIRYERGHGLSAKTVRNIASTLHHALSDAVRDNYLSSNPAHDIDLPKWERADLQVWDSQQFAHFLQVAADDGDPYYPLWRLVVTTGIRRGELLGLRWCDVNLLDAEITISQTRQTNAYKNKITTPKTKAGRRTIAIDIGTVVALEKHKLCLMAAANVLEIPLADFVAVSLDGRPISGQMLMNRFAAAADRAKLPRCRLHDLRHAAAADALSRGIPVHIVAGRLGHANPSITLNIYAAFLPRADRDVANAGGTFLDKLMDDAKARTERAPRTDKRTKNEADDNTRATQ